MVGIGKAFAIVGGLLVGAVGAYNFTTTGCPLGGVCGDETRASATVAETQTATRTQAPACPLCEAAGESAAAPCDPASCDRPDCDPSQCPEAMKAQCASKVDCDPSQCPEAMKAQCAGKADCDPSQCPHAQAAEQAAEVEASEVPACCAEKADQDKPADSDG